MKRVMVIGPCGSGKSTFARRLAEALCVPVIHMDRLAWSPGWRMTPRAAYDAALRASVAGDNWILDGNTKSADVNQAADTVIFLDFPRWLCMWRILKRIVTYAGRVRPDMADGCPERLDWEFLEYVWNYRDAIRPKLVQRLQRFANGKRLIVLASPAQVEAFFRQTRSET